MTPLQLGNVKARLRMIYLCNLASIHRGCVLDTDNRTEHELGFWTIHGDVGDLNCGLIYLWKTEVYELAHYLLDYYVIKEPTAQPTQQSIAIFESIKLTPTDGNGVMSGGDCAQFGLDNYEQVDDVLKTMYFPENGIMKDKEEYIRLIDSYNEQGVDKVMSLHQNSKFKRQHLPIAPVIIR
jgi:NH3-dependent NAD+ synthetase